MRREASEHPIRKPPCHCRHIAPSCTGSGGAGEETLLLAAAALHGAYGRRPAAKWNERTRNRLFSSGCAHIQAKKGPATNSAQQATSRLGPFVNQRQRVTQSPCCQSSCCCLLAFCLLMGRVRTTSSGYTHSVISTTSSISN